MSYIYLASPYTDQSEEVMEDRYEKAACHTAQMLQAERFVYSPIVHCHELAKKYNLPRDIAFWRDYNTTMLRCAKQLQVLRLDGWQVSLGVRFEMDLATKLLIPIYYIPE